MTESFNGRNSAVCQINTVNKVKVAPKFPLLKIVAVNNGRNWIIRICYPNFW